MEGHQHKGPSQQRSDHEQGQSPGRKWADLGYLIELKLKQGVKGAGSELGVGRAKHAYLEIANADSELEKEVRESKKRRRPTKEADQAGLHRIRSRVLLAKILTPPEHVYEGDSEAD